MRIYTSFSMHSPVNFPFLNFWSKQTLNWESESILLSYFLNFSRDIYITIWPRLAIIYPGKTSGQSPAALYAIQLLPSFLCTTIWHMNLARREI